MTADQTLYWLSASANVDATASAEFSKMTAVASNLQSRVTHTTLSDMSLFNYPSSSYNVLTSAQNLPTEDDYKKGFMYRYLFRLAANPYDNIKECDAGTYQEIQYYALYSGIKIKWKIIGDAAKARTINENIANKSNKELFGVTEFLLRDTLLHWKNIKDVVEEVDVTEKMKATQQIPSPSTNVPISEIPAINRDIDTEGVVDILTEEYDDLIVEDKTYF